MNKQPIPFDRLRAAHEEHRKVSLPPSNLPIPPNDFIGRGTVVEEVCRLVLSENVRLLTLTGPGGVGKTRIAIQSAEDLRPAFEDGVWFVPLASITNPDLVVPAIAGVLGRKEEGSIPVADSLKAMLQEKTLLLVLDNFEQVANAAPRITELIAQAPGVQVIITSRMPLRLYGEHQFPVPLMDLPEGNHADPARLANYDAVRLFITRAREIDNTFALTSGNAGTVVDICRRLDCLPLAIELAAARLRLFSPQALLSRLDRSLPLLTGGARDLAARQQSLRNTIDWSYNLLEPAEQKLFTIIPVFVGGCTLNALEHIYTLLELEASDLPDQLESLIAQNLVRRRDQPNGEPRYWMLVTIREYGLERLASSDYERKARDAHASFFFDLAEQFGAAIRSSEQATWLDRMETEYDNLRATIQWYLTTAQITLVARMCGEIWMFWQARGYVSEGRQWLEKIVLAAGPLIGEQTDAFRRSMASVYNSLGSLAGAQSDFSRANEAYARSLEITRDLGDKRSIARTLNNMGIFLSQQGLYAEAESCFQESFDLKQEVGDQVGISSAYNRLAEIAHIRGDYLRAEQHFNTSLALRRERNDMIWIADTLQNLSELYYDQGNFARCAELVEESLALAQPINYKELSAYLLFRRGLLRAEQREYSQAIASFEEGLDLARSIGDPIGISKGLQGLGQVAAAQNDHKTAIGYFRDALQLQIKSRVYNAEMAGTLEWLGTLHLALEPATTENTLYATRLLAAAEALREKMGAPITPANQARYNIAMQAARSLQSQADFDAGWKLGRGLTFEQAAALASGGTVDQPTGISMNKADAEQSQSKTEPATTNGNELSEREIGVLRLLAGGLTNREIAEQLVLSPRTVQAHLYNIFNKIDVTTRTAASRYALERGLA